MNDPRFEVYPWQHKGSLPRPDADRETFGWRFRDANGKITFVAGEGFTRRVDAHRALTGAVYDVVRLLVGQRVGLDLDPVIPVVDVNEAGEVIDVDSSGREAATRPDERVE